jgi:NAD(P)H-dependent flavin oxidoreductase YrpB (nitropropane dioxygenase family)
VVTDPLASPTGFPFKVLQMEGTHSDAATYEQRTRTCDLGYLRHAYKKPDGTIGWRCPSEDVDDYIRKGGKEEDTRGRKCVCNGLMANIGLGQIQRGGEHEKPLITTGADLSALTRIAPPCATTYSAADVVRFLLPQSQLPAKTPGPLPTR